MPLSSTKEKKSSSSSSDSINFCRLFQDIVFAISLFLHFIELKFVKS